MKVEIIQETYNGKTSNALVPRKYNADKDKGLTKNDIIIGKFRFDAKTGLAVRKKDTQYAKAGDTFPYGFGVIEWTNCPPEYQQYLDDTYQNIKLTFGQISNIRGWIKREDKTAIINQDDEFFIGLVPFKDKEGKEKVSLTMEKIGTISAEQYKQATLCRENNAEPLEEVTFTKDGVAKTATVLEFVPFWTLKAPLEYVKSKVV